MRTFIAKTMLAAAVFCLVAAPLVQADTPTNATPVIEKGIGKIEGVIKDAKTGKIITDVYVCVEGCLNAAMTNESGKFYLNELPCGDCVLKATRKGYKPVEIHVTVQKKTGQYVLEMKALPKPVEPEEET